MALKTKSKYLETARRYRETHKESHREWYQTIGKQKEAILRITVKVEVLTYYGKRNCACVTCGESRLACLSIDHINGNGCKERKRFGSNRYGYKFYLYLKKNNYPKGYQTLCMNCQFMKAVYDRAKKKEVPE
ncbi:hypothetical protein LCGC14_1589440 [marine sediment metagenome]|uniref:Uncharacterized protein n=1 Tax=marine sediment metagenome TaxID=412755 RepID=A0A0F9IEQ7_9ZZZZ